MRGAVFAATALCAWLGPHRAHADAPPPPATGSADVDPAVEDTANANLEPVGRHGVVVAGAIMPSEFIGLGSRADTGLSGSFSLRLGKVASTTTTMYIEGQAAALVHKPAGQATATNSLAVALVGALHYVAPSLWLRIGFGAGAYTRDQEPIAPGGVLVAHERLGGMASNLGLGLDLVRWRYAALGVEASSTLLIHRDGWTTMSGFGVDLTF